MTTVDVAPAWSRRGVRLGLLVAAALASRGIVAAWTTTIGSDSAFYLETSERFGKGEVQEGLDNNYQFHPLYPAAVAGAAIPLGSHERAGYAVSVIASSLAVVPLFFLVELLWSATIGWWSAVLYALHPAFVLECSEIANTGLFLSLFITSLALGLRAIAGRHWVWYPLAGLSLGLCYLTRPEGLMAGAFVATAWAIAGVRQLRRDPGGKAWLRWGGGAAALLAVFLLVALPFLVWIHGKTGHWLITHRRSGVGLWKSLVEGPPAGDPVKASPIPPPPKPPQDCSSAPDEGPAAETVAVPRKEIEDRAHGSRQPVLVMLRMMERAIYWPLTPFLLLGLATAPRQGGRWPVVAALVVLSLVAMAPSMVRYAVNPEFRPSTRNLLPGVVFLLPLISSGLLTSGSWLNRRLGPTRWGRIVSFYPWPGLAFLGILLQAHALGPRRSEERALVEAGAWVRGLPVPPPHAALVSTEKMSYYAGVLADGLPGCDGRTRMVKADGEWRRCDPADPASVCHCIGEALEKCGRHTTSLILLHDQAVRKYHAGYVEDLKKAGFVQVAAFYARKKGDVSVRAYRLEAP